MTRNLGKLDRILRGVAGTLLILLALLTNILAAPAWLAPAAIVVGVVLLATAAVSFCPLYRIAGIRTCQL